MQRRPGVAHRGRELLPAVDVAQGDVVDAVEARQRHDIEAPLADLALHARSRLDAGGEAVRDHDAACRMLLQVGPHEGHGMVDGIGLRAHHGARPHVADDARFEVRDAVEAHGSVRIVDHDGVVECQRVGEHVDALTQEPRLESEACRRVVVAAGDDHVRAGVGEAAQRVAEERVARRRRCRGIEDVTGDDHDVDVVLAHLLDEVLQHATQRIERRVTVEGSPDVPVGGVQDAHADRVDRPSDTVVEALRSVLGVARDPPGESGDVGIGDVEAGLRDAAAHGMLDGCERLSGEVGAHLLDEPVELLRRGCVVLRHRGAGLLAALVESTGALRLIDGHRVASAIVPVVVAVRCRTRR